MNLCIRPALPSDLDAVEQLYTELNDHLAAHGNPTGWRPGVYPLRRDAEEGLHAGTLYVAETNGQIVGSVMYLQNQGDPYRAARWQLPYDVPVIVLHILAVHPRHQGAGVGRALLEYAETVGRQQHARAIRLDTHENNLPACRLYEKCGYSFCGLIDLGLEQTLGLKWYRTYEKLL